MLKQYDILTLCQNEVESCQLPVIDKLKLRMQLIQAKRLLLNGEVRAKIKDDEISEREFEDVYDCVRHVCNSDGEVGEVEELISRLMRLKENLEIQPE